ncbi:MAG: hypothetical protein Q9214_001596 [Letrouitia sp. 1 TL-2023]
MNSQVARRYACDRCREQKLRCPRSWAGDSTCDRCLRLGAYCVTGSGRPLGRPPLLANHTNGGQVGSEKSLCYERKGRQTWHRRHGISRISTPLPSPRGTSGSDSPGTPTYNPSQSEVMLDMRLNETDFLKDASDLAGFDLNSSTSEQQFGLDPINVPGLESENQGDRVEPQNTNLADPAGLTAANNSREYGNSQPNGAVDGDSMTFLVGVLGSISHQVLELRNQSWESWNPLRMPVALFNAGNPDLTCSGPVCLNPCQSTLCITTKFILVLQTMGPAHYPTAPPAYSLPDLSMTLMILSTYIQLIQLFDTLVIRISNCLQEISGHSEPLSPSSLAATRKLYSPQPASLHIVIMIQVFEHQLHSMETLMGLPASCRLWSQKDTYTGVLGQGKSDVLAQAVMGQAQEIMYSLKQGIDRIRSSHGSSLVPQNSIR